MNPFSLCRHLERAHGVDDADRLDTQEANRAHHAHHFTPPHPNHQHEWDGIVADPQGPIEERP